MRGTQYWALLGIALSVYALYVEHESSKAQMLDQEYEALCDIKWLGVSCSKVFNSKYGRMMSYFGIVPNGHTLDVPNAALGILFYSCVFILPYLKPIPKQAKKVLLMLAATLSCATSAFLGYILVTVLKDLCLVCTSTYVVNFFIFVLAARDLCAGKDHTD